MATTPTSASSPSERPELGSITRLLARIRGRAIDDQLLEGRVPSGSRIVRARLARLLDRRYRADLADALRRLLEAAKQPRANPFAAEIPLQVREVLQTEPLILTLAAELEQEQPVSPRGVILADRLLRDGGSPVYWRSDVKVKPDEPVESVEMAVKHARAALLLA